MEKAAVIYWSGSGNTEAMANEICDGIKAGGMDCELYNVSDFKGNIADYSKIALGCPAMGDEVLEETYQAKRLLYLVHTAGVMDSG